MCCAVQRRHPPASRHGWLGGWVVCYGTLSPRPPGEAVAGPACLSLEAPPPSPPLPPISRRRSSCLSGGGSPAWRLFHGRGASLVAVPSAVCGGERQREERGAGGEGANALRTCRMNRVAVVGPKGWRGQSHLGRHTKAAQQHHSAGVRHAAAALRRGRLLPQGMSYCSCAKGIHNGIMPAKRAKRRVGSCSHPQRLAVCGVCGASAWGCECGALDASRAQCVGVLCSGLKRVLLLRFYALAG